jgi:muconate cycloisomerase
MHSRVRGCRVAKAAVETAVLDMMARDRDEPLHRFFGGRGDFRLSLSYSVSLQDVEAEAEMAAELYRSGYRAFKLKTGVLRPEEDVERLVALRERCPEARLRLDYNECASEEALRAILGPAHEVGVEYCEQPFPTGQDARLGRLRSWFDLPLSLDESIATTQDLLRAAEQGLCEYVSLKCGKVGGPVRMLRMAELAVELGLRPYVGSLSETRLGVSAVMAAMSAAEGLAFGSDFYFPYLIVDDSSISGGPRTGSGWLRLPTASGHGCLVPDEWWEDPSADHLAL